MKNLKNLDELRFYMIYHYPSRSYVVTSKNKMFWMSRSSAKIAFKYHTGQNFDKVRNINGRKEFRIKEFRLTEVPKKNITFADLYAKKVGQFLK